MRKVVGILSANALGIYLFQHHPLIWQHFVSVKNPPELPAGELLWRFPLTVAGLAVCGLVCNAAINFIFEKSRLSALPGFIRASVTGASGREHGAFGAISKLLRRS